MNTNTAWERLQLIRNPLRPTIKDYLPRICTDFTELHGDRLCGDDGAILGGICRIGGTPVTLLAQVKGRNLKENQAANFAMPHPEGYRKALRLAKQAEKFHRPVVCLIDTPGAFCDIDAENRGQGEAIARNLAEFMQLRTPVISIVLGEGGSGGALALAVADEVWMLQDAYYSVISPEGAASILWKDAKRAKEAAESLRLTAKDLFEFGVIERIVDPADVKQKGMPSLKAALFEALSRYSALSDGELLEGRYAKFRKIGGTEA